MERYTRLLDWKNKYFENDYITPSDLQIQCNLYQTTNGIFHQNQNKKSSQFIWKHKRSKQSKQSSERKTELEKSTFLTSYYKATVIKKVWYWQKNRNIDQWNETESPETNPHIYGQPVFDKGSKNVQWRKDNLFNEQCQGNCTAICKRIKLEHFVTPYKKETQNGLQT